jgi:CubicO group peptidase (beta-lactamase class C family)
MKSGFSLPEAVHSAWRRTGIPGVAAGLSVAGERTFAAAGVGSLDTGERVTAETPFRIASITKPFVAALAADCLSLDEPVCARLSHTAGLRPESREPLPAGAEGLWSYSNAGYWDVGEACTAACGGSFEAALETRVLRPLGLDATGFEEPAAPARGHLQLGESGHHAVPLDAYPTWRRPSGGLWSTVGDLVRFGEAQLSGDGRLHTPQAEALGAAYALGWWVRRLTDGRTVLDHEGSVAGYQSLLLLVPEDGLVLALLTNSWRGSGLVRRVVEGLSLVPRAPGPPSAAEDVAGSYALDTSEAVVAGAGQALNVTERDTDPVTGASRSFTFPASPVGGGVFGFGGGLLMSHRLDFPRPGLARIGWVVLPRTAP